MHDDELDGLLAVADREFLWAFHTSQAPIRIGLVAILGDERDEVPARRKGSPELTTASVPEALFTRIDEVERLLDEDHEWHPEVLGLLHELKLGLDDQTLSREQALALVRQAITYVNETCECAMTSRAVVIDNLRAIGVAIERLFDDADDRAGRFR